VKIQPTDLLMSKAPQYGLKVGFWGLRFEDQKRPSEEEITLTLQTKSGKKQAQSSPKKLLIAAIVVAFRDQFSLFRSYADFRSHAFVTMLFN